MCSKKVREAKALMLVHQYELFKMKDDESIEQMCSRFQTLVYGLQVVKKTYVASDHVSKILRSLLARWRPKVTAIKEAKDLIVTPCFPNNVNNTNNQSIQCKTECHTTKLYK